ncbi:hypothetical protein B0O80DRAFT_222511 [Mortierella sp. GBAus27b]|nr:hypothetical protein B0O80DRAFT_222511 [Mortierella sp. GBAus27b]
MLSILTLSSIRAWIMVTLVGFTPLLHKFTLIVPTVRASVGCSFRKFRSVTVAGSSGRGVPPDHLHHGRQSLLTTSHSPPSGFPGFPPPSLFLFSCLSHLSPGKVLETEPVSQSPWRVMRRMRCCSMQRCTIFLAATAPCFFSRRRHGTWHVRSCRATLILGKGGGHDCTSGTNTKVSAKVVSKETRQKRT